MCHLNCAQVLNAQYIPIARSDTQQDEVSYVRTYITHKLLCSFSLKMRHLSRVRHLNSRLVLNARYNPIACSDTQQAEVSHVHTHIISILLYSFSLKMCHPRCVLLLKDVQS